MANTFTKNEHTLYEQALDKCQNWWGKEKLTDLWHKKFYKNFWTADRQARRVTYLIKKKYDTDIFCPYTVVEDKQSGKYFVVFYWTNFQKEYGNGTYDFEISDYGHFFV